MVRVGKQFFRLFHFPGVEEANLSRLQSPPYALFLPELGETSLVHQFIMQEKDKTARTPMRAVERMPACQIDGMELIQTVSV